MTKLSEETLSHLKRIQKSLTEKKCEKVEILDLRSVNSYLSLFVIATVKTETQGRSVAKDIEKFMKPLKLAERRNHITDLPKDATGWILLDYGEICIHIMTEEMRNYYALERLWGDASPIQL
ncbi:ribosomal silencing factor RsfS [Leptospira ryugenii]|uniref:Ribosomal silencing factor RsfS n=1 Tax=Leptospira ryugenii TaxID=1917863 RepID=A0A2P2DX09_9LEPT|nr:ribosome silencing factor [Leptospira ryugenii]GBF49171.1 ribosomal silencing factor RsfS [Leptospira ryugenii]